MEIYVADWNGKNMRRLTVSKAVDISPSWNPRTGREIASLPIETAVRRSTSWMRSTKSGAWWMKADMRRGQRGHGRPADCVRVAKRQDVRF